MWELDYKESWVLKNWCFWTVALEKTLKSPLDCKEIQPVNLKGNQSWIFIGRTDAEAETPILWPPDAKGWLIGKYPESGKDWKQKEKGTTDDETVGPHHQLNGREFEQVPEVGDGQEGLACCSPWGHKEWDMTEQPNWTEQKAINKSFPGGLAVKNMPTNAGDAGSIPGSGRFPWKRKWKPTPVFLPEEIPWTEGGWWATVQGLQRSQTRLCN